MLRTRTIQSLFRRHFPRKVSSVHCSSKANLKTRYITDGTLKWSERVEMDEEKKRIANKWKWLPDDASEEIPESTNGNVTVRFIKNNARLGDYFDIDASRNPNMVPSYAQISSALALYRTISLFECGINKHMCDHWKVNWNVVLKHEETGGVLVLSEWTGGFAISTPFDGVKYLDQNYKRDAEELLTLLVSPSMTIGYDGTVAGTVA